jgi:hypothetical protein
MWDRKAKELSGSGFAIDFVLDDARKVVHGKGKKSLCKPLGLTDLTPVFTAGVYSRRDST